jgi:hypothetical protein
MSMEVHVLLRSGAIPSISRWNDVLRENALPLTIPSGFDLLKDHGWRPFELRGQKAGVEVYFEPDLKSELETYPDLATAGPRFDCVVAFRFGGRADECAIASLASASLALATDGLVYDTEQGEQLEAGQALVQARNVLADLFP